MIVDIDNPIELADTFEVELVWMDQDQGHQGRSYLFKIQLHNCWSVDKRDKVRVQR